MSQQAITNITNAAIKMWQECSDLSYAEFIQAAKLQGLFWGAKEVL